jgi:uncharacterized membrane protein
MVNVLQQWCKVPRLARLLILLVIIACVSLADNYEGDRHHADVGLILLCQSAFFILLIVLTFYANVIHKSASQKEP